MEQNELNNVNFLNLSSEEAQKLGIGVMFHDDEGNYKWIYCVDMNKNPIMLKTVLIVMQIAYLPVWILALYMSIERGVDWEILGIIFLCYLAVMLIAVGATWFIKVIYKGNYFMVYQMNEEGIWFAQVTDQADKTKMIASLNAAIGAASGNVGQVISGSAMTIAAGSAYSRFKKVRRIRASRQDELIRMTSFLLYQMIFVPEKDYDFVWNYITERCTRADIKA